jgi:predicted RNA-binding protein with PUA-like domain
MARWLVKTDPDTYAWKDLVREGTTSWGGVRNAQARLNLIAMKKGDDVLVYHSGDDKAVVGTAKVARSAYPDPTADDPRWVAVDLTVGNALGQWVPLADVRMDRALGQMVLVKNSRLSVQPVTDAEYRRVLTLGDRTRRKG